MSLRSALRPHLRFLDVLLWPIFIVAAVVLKFYRKLGPKHLKLTSKKLREMGLFPITNHYYEPLLNVIDLRQTLSQERNLPAIHLDSVAQLNFLRNLKYASELHEINLEENSSSKKELHLNNGQFESGDLEFLYQMVRYLKPKKVIEIGGGYSTLVISMALKKNREETDYESMHICVEPYENEWLEQVENLTIIREIIQTSGINWSEALGKDDLLFIDSSHMIKPQGDVLYEYLEIIPKLASGVFVHVHDIFTPRDYPEEWLVREFRFWNEQYILEALLGCTHRYQIVASLNWLRHKHFERLQEVTPYLTDHREPGSFYFKVQ
jgi:predicted O-methyltransferase YrrM